jgi:hypothetical protein
MQITREESDFYLVEAEHGDDIINKIMILPQFFLDNTKEHAWDIINNKSGVNLI